MKTCENCGADLTKLHTVGAVIDPVADACYEYECEACHHQWARDGSRWPSHYDIVTGKSVSPPGAHVGWTGVLQSQAGQDAWVIEHGVGPGYFVDVGAHDGIVHSNTYALEQLGWRGVCVEPDPAVVGQLEANRACEVSGYAISSERGATTIRPAGVLVASETLGQLLVTCAPPVIDYLSIDVEGHELEVLAGMDFDRWHVNLITIEHNLYCDGPERKNAIYGVLTGYGFERVMEDIVAPGYGAYEDWYRYVG